MKEGLTRVTVTELCEREGITHSLVVSLVELEIVRPVEGANIENWVFDATGAHWVTKALRLHRDLDLDWIAIGMLVDLLQEREELHRENVVLRRQLKRFLVE